MKKLNLSIESVKPIRGGYLIPINASKGRVAATLKTSNHRAGNIICPEGGRAEMGVLEIRYEK